MSYQSKKLQLSESDFQREVQSFVQREVICCITMMMFALIKWCPDQMFDEFFQHFLQEDEYGNFIEIYQYWFVSSYLAAKLEAKGEIIVHDFFGQCVWGRTTTGQSISMDCVMREIWFELKQ